RPRARARSCPAARPRCGRWRPARSPAACRSSRRGARSCTRCRRARRSAAVARWLPCVRPRTCSCSWLAPRVRGVQQRASGALARPTGITPLRSVLGRENAVPRGRLCVASRLSVGVRRGDDLPGGDAVDRERRGVLVVEPVRPGAVGALAVLARVCEVARARRAWAAERGAGEVRRAGEPHIFRRVDVRVVLAVAALPRARLVAVLLILLEDLLARRAGRPEPVLLVDGAVVHG